ncbi:hypothetical protein [Mycolicibacterium sp. 624]|uniref:hypothetical protein n=1 Tax=Mycolicibacterium sp. 624 TaxID=3156314 RepID=UPI0033991BED
MTYPETAPTSDAELLHIARSVLAEEGYSIESLASGIDLVLAENPYFVVAVAAVNTIQELLLIGGIAEASLAERLNVSTIGPKKWDAYLVLLTQERSPEDDATTRDLYAINYDTARLRRIAHTGVDATPEAVAHALAPFVAPMEASSTEILQDPFAAFVDALATRGVPREFANRAASAFEQGASLDDVL